MKNLGLFFLPVAAVFVGLALLSNIPGEYEDFIKGMSFNQERNTEIVRLRDGRESRTLTFGLVGAGFATIGVILIVVSGEKNKISKSINEK